MTIEALKKLKESEDKIEFKAAQHNFSFAGSEHKEQIDRRKCFLGYVVAFANEGGGMLVLGMADNPPHDVVGTDFAQGKTGALENETYARLGIRVNIEEPIENGKRVMVTHIPSRPIGKMLKFEGVPLMRVGESLRNMSDEEIFTILSEQEPDFSAKICEGLTINNLDTKAIDVLKDKYATKQNNPGFRTLAIEHVLSDLDLLKDGKLTYAALILLGTKDAIKDKLPQAKTILEFRNNESQIASDWRDEVDEALFTGIDKIWNYVNARNISIPVSTGPYIFNISAFNEDVIREAVLNAIAHRDYSLTSETLIKLFPKKIIITNPGGFPKGVTLENILTVNSTPRSRLLADVRLKTGLVERSGQGVDKMFSISLSEGKAEPDYSSSDYFQVSLNLSGDVIDKPFNIFINETQKKRSTDNQLGVHEIITLAKIRSGYFSNLKNEIVQKLESDKLIQRIGGGHSNKYVLNDFYLNLMKQPANVGSYVMSEVKTLIGIFDATDEIKMGMLVVAFEGSLSREQVKYLVEKLLADKVIVSDGKGSGTKYRIAGSFANKENRWSQIEAYLMKKYI